MKYLVMECRNAYAVVLTDDGQFLKVANMHYEVGQTVGDVTPLQLPEEKRTPSRRWISTLAAMAACLVLVFSSLLLSSTTYASVYITINPQVRIDVNRKDVVVGVTGVNEDGVVLLEGYDYNRKDLDTVMDELVDRAVDMGFLHEGGTITVQLDADAQWVSSHSTHISDHISAHLSTHVTDGITVTIDIFDTQEVPSTPAEPTLPAGPIVIPLDPQAEIHYGESDYGDDDKDEDRDDDDNKSDDKEDDDDGQTDYDDRDHVTEKNDDSGYDKGTDYSKDKESDFDQDDDD